jgi:hypothetical protein
MDTYHIAEEQVSLGKRVGGAFAGAAVWLLVFSAIIRLMNGRWNSPIALGVGGAVFFFGTLLAGSWWPPETPRVDLEVDDDEIRMVWKRKVIRKARRERVRYVREWSGLFGARLVISEHGTVGTRFFGRVTVPRSLLAPDHYERVKAQALSWLDNSKK